MKKTYELLISEVDHGLHILREFLVDATGSDKEALMKRINNLLDERLRLMALRDAVPE